MLGIAPVRACRRSAFARLPEDVELLERARAMRARAILDADPELARARARADRGRDRARLRRRRARADPGLDRIARRDVLSRPHRRRHRAAITASSRDAAPGRRPATRTSKP